MTGCSKSTEWKVSGKDGVTKRTGMIWPNFPCIPLPLEIRGPSREHSATDGGDGTRKGSGRARSRLHMDPGRPLVDGESAVPLLSQGTGLLPSLVLLRGGKTGPRRAPLQSRHRDHIFLL